MILTRLRPLLAAAAAASALAFGALPAAAAPLPVDPFTGGEGWFYWDADEGSTGDDLVFSLGPVYPGDAEIKAAGRTALEVMLTGPRLFTFSVTDCCAGGDEFALRVNGAEVDWTSTGLTTGAFSGAPVNFTATRTGLLLGPGSNLIDLLVTVQAQDFTVGAAQWTLSAAAPIPLPAAGWLLLGGLGGLGLIARRRRAAA